MQMFNLSVPHHSIHYIPDATAFFSHTEVHDDEKHYVFAMNVEDIGLVAEKYALNAEFDDNGVVLSAPCGTRVGVARPVA